MKRVSEDDRPRSTKLIYFYKSGDSKFQGLRVPVNTRRYRNLDALLDDLSYRIPGLSYGARRVATPRGRHMVTKVEDLSHLSSYICTDKVNTKRIAAVNIDKISSGSDFQFRGNFMHPPKTTQSSSTIIKKKKSRSPSKKKKIARTSSEPTAALRNGERKPRPPKRQPRQKNTRPSQSEPKSKGQASKHSKNNAERAVQGMSLSGLRTLRSAHSEGSLERSRTVGELTPLDSNKLRHVQRRRIATKQVNPSVSDSAQSTRPPKAPKKGAKKKKQSTASINGDDVTLVDVRSATRTRKHAWTEEENLAATKIQSHYRGYRVRKEYNNRSTSVTSRSKSTSPSSDREKEEAAIKIQSHFRGYKTRKEFNEIQEEDDGRSTAASQNTAGEETLLSSKSPTADSGRSGSLSRTSTAHTRPKSIMIEDEAAVRIQAAYRGYNTRKQLKQEPQNSSSESDSGNNSLKDSWRSGSRLTNSGVSMVDRNVQTTQLVTAL